MRGAEWKKVMEATWDMKKDRRLPRLGGLRGDKEFGREENESKQIMFVDAIMTHNALLIKMHKHF